MREHAGKLTGVLNGLNDQTWNPATDSLLPSPFTAANLTGKKASRDSLLSAMGLAPEPGGPVFVALEGPGKNGGIDLLLPAMDRLLADDVRLIILGKKKTAYEREWIIAARRHAGRFVYGQDPNDALTHLAFAGADVILMPSHFEHGSVSAMQALTCGTLPVAFAAEGLYEVIQDYDPTDESGNGFLFFEKSAEAFWDAIKRAKHVFKERAAWEALTQRAMAADFSWAKTAGRYEALYDRLLRRVAK